MSVDEITPHFRADFRQPRENPMNLQIPAPIRVELYPHNSKLREPFWLARVSNGTTLKSVKDRDIGVAKDQVKRLFEHQLSNWQPFNPVTGENITLPKGWTPGGRPVHLPADAGAAGTLCGLKSGSAQAIAAAGEPYTCKNCSAIVSDRLKKVVPIREDAAS